MMNCMMYIRDMKTPVTRMTERGQDRYTCVVTIVRNPKRKDAKAMLGYASTFRKLRTIAEWMKELREGELSASL